MKNLKKINELVTANIKLARFHANETKDLDNAEAFSAAMDGLFLAAKVFNEKRGVPFGSFASLHIKWKLGNLRKFSHAEKRNKNMEAFSLDAPVWDDSDMTFGERVSDEKSLDLITEVHKQDNENVLLSSLKELNSRQQKILSLSFGIGKDDGGMTAKNIAKILKISPQRVIQIREQAFRKLRKNLSTYFCEKSQDFSFDILKRI